MTKTTDSFITQAEPLITELRGFADGSTSARATLMRDAADALEGLLGEYKRLTTESQWEYGAGYEADNGVEMRWFSIDGDAFTVREAAENEVERYSDAQIRLIRRQRPGPWVPVEGEDQ